MITRSAKRRSMHLKHNSFLVQVPDNEMQIQSRSCISIGTSGFIPSGNEQFQKSVCTVFIHPPTHEIIPIKLTMSGIQPCIRVCPNKALELNTGNESRQLRSVLGDMELPFETNLAGRNYLELGNNISSQRCLTDNVSEETNEIKNSSPKSRKGNFSSLKSSSNEGYNNKEISSNTFDIDSIKLYKPVVVLEDICRTKYYKATFANHAARDRIKTNAIETQTDVSNLVLKQENLKSSTGMIDNRHTNTADSTYDRRHSLESVDNTSLNGSRLLTQLAEGCSFSEILNRFRIKNGNCLVNTVQCTDTINHENFNTECLENQVIKSETCSSYEDENTMEMTSEVTEKIESTDFEESNMLSLPQYSEYGELREDAEHLRNQSLDSHMGSDDIENTTATWSISRGVSADEETVDSSFLTAHMVPYSCYVTTSEEICSTSETSKNLLSNMNNSDLNLHESEQPNLEVDKEKMRNKKFHGSNKSKSKKNKLRSSTPKTSRSSKPKKTKQSDEKWETFHNQGKLPDEYIPLQTSGPTKFGVAMLNQIKPYVQHDAKDFKNKALFGDRNRRVASSQNMRMYKLKQQVNRSVRR